MTSDSEQSNRLIEIGSKVSLLFEDQSLSNASNNLLFATLLLNIEEEESSEFRFLNFSELKDKTWIQIGENKRVYGKEKNGANHNENLVFRLDNFMIKDLLDSKMVYAGITHPRYNIKTKEVEHSTIKTLSTSFE